MGFFSDSVGDTKTKVEDCEDCGGCGFIERDGEYDECGQVDGCSGCGGSGYKYTEYYDSLFHLTGIYAVRKSKIVDKGYRKGSGRQRVKYEYCKNENGDLYWREKGDRRPA